MIRHAIRRLLRAKTFTLAAVVTLMLGIGGTAAVFTLVDSVLLRPMPYDHADRLVDLSHVLDVSGPVPGARRVATARARGTERARGSACTIASGVVVGAMVISALSLSSGTR